MSDARLRGANKEITDCKNDKSSEINVDLIDKLAFSSLWFFDGVQDTPYEGGHIAVHS
jgi:ubiquitin-conjugating enzyme (huntingtin interacting protein 2)